MTYVVGVRKGDVDSIHADSQLSANGKLFDVASLKCGILFPGCIFGLAGDFEDGLCFVELSRRAVMHLPTMSEQWSMFEQVCFAYNPGDSLFQMLLSTRVNGHPSFYLYRSEKRGLIVASGDFYTLGSGGPLYEKRVSRFVTHDFRDMAPAADFPYHLHALLNESLYGEAKADADAHGVGGFFTFVMQDERGEMRQRPTASGSSIRR